MPNQIVKPAQHQLYDNEVLAVKLDEILETYLNAQNLMTVDASLVEAAGMWKTINTYTYAPAEGGEGDGKWVGLKPVGIGEGTDESAIVKLEAVNHEVKVHQQMFQYADEEIMRDPRILEVAMKGMAETMANHLNQQFFDAISSDQVLNHNAEAQPFSYELVVDALAGFANAKAAHEDEAGLFLLVNHVHRAEIRKDPDFVSAQLGKILFDGQIGTIAGIPVIVSRKVPAGEAYLMSKEAVTCFVKKASEVEQERIANTRTNKIYGRKVNLVAVTDSTKIVRLKIQVQA